MQESTLTPEQLEILEGVYDLRDSGEITQEEKEHLADAFADPKTFAILRKALSIFTPGDLGMFLSGDLQQLSAENDEELGRELRIARTVDQRLRSGLVALYLNIERIQKTRKKAEFEEANRIEIAEKKSAEADAEFKKESSQSVGTEL